MAGSGLLKPFGGYVRDSWAIERKRKTSLREIGEKAGSHVRNREEKKSVTKRKERTEETDADQVQGWRREEKRTRSHKRPTGGGLMRSIHPIVSLGFPF